MSYLEESKVVASRLGMRRFVPCPQRSPLKSGYCHVMIHVPWSGTEGDCHIQCRRSLRLTVATVCGVSLKHPMIQILTARAQVLRLSDHVSYSTPKEGILPGRMFLSAEDAIAVRTRP